MDNGEATGTLTYTTTVLSYGNRKRSFDIEYDETSNLITVLIKVKFVPYDIHWEHKTTGAIKSDSKTGKPEIVPYEWGKTKEGESGTGSYVDYRYKYVPRTVSATFLSQLKARVESALNSTPYFLIPDPCCGNASPCQHKIPMKLFLEAEEKVSSPHETVNLFSISSRADSGNWSEAETGARDMYNIIAHEVGHLFGWPDEYFRFGGGVHNMYVKSDRTIDQTMAEPADDWKREANKEHLMVGGKTKMQPYYMGIFRDWFNRKTGKTWKVVT